MKRIQGAIITGTLTSLSEYNQEEPNPFWVGTE